MDTNLDNNFLSSPNPIQKDDSYQNALSGMVISKINKTPFRRLLNWTGGWKIVRKTVFRTFSFPESAIFRSAPWIESYGHSQHRKSAINGLVFQIWLAQNYRTRTLRMFKNWVWPGPISYLESSFLTAQAWRNERLELSKVPLQDRYWLVWKTIQVAGSKIPSSSLVIHLKARHAQLNRTPSISGL